MPRWLRTTLIALAALLLLLVAGAAWLVAGFDANRYKGVAIDWMKTEHRRTLAIDGPIELSVFPRLQVRASRVSLSEAGRADNFAAIGQAALSVQVLPLLRGRLVVDKVQASGVRVVLLRDAQGRRNIDDLLDRQPPAAGSAPAPSTAAQPLDFDVSGIELADVQARVNDVPAGIDGQLTLQRLQTGRIASQVETRVQLAASFAFKSPALQGQLDGSTRVTPDLATRSVRLADMDLRLRGDVPGASAVQAELRGALAWDGGRAALSAQDLKLNFAANSAGLKLAESTLALQRFDLDPAAEALSLRQLQLRLKGTRAGQPLAAELDWPELDVKGADLKGSALAGKFSMSGAAPLSASFRSGAPSGSFQSVKVPALQGQIEGEANGLKLAATLHTELALARPGRVKLGNIDLKGSLQRAGAAAVTLALRGQAEASAQRAQWEASGQLSGSAFESSGNAILAGATPEISAQLRFDALDLNALLPAAPPGTGTGTAPGKAADTPIDLAALRSVDATLGLRAKALAWRSYRVADARIDAVLDAGMLRVNTLHGQVWGGSVDGSAFADARASRVTLKATASGVDVNALLHDVAAKDVLEGRGKVAVDIESAGRSVGEMKAHLRGTGSLQLRDGAVKGVNLAKAFRQAKATLGQLRGGAAADTAQPASRTEKTDFSELSASFRIDDGVARNSDLDLKSPFLRLGGDGSIDIGRSRIDYTARATVADTTKGQDGAELAALRGVTVPVRLTGPFEAVDWHIDWSKVAATAVQNRLEDKLKERLGLKAPAGTASAPAGDAKQPDVKQPDVKQQLRDKLLKGLFK